MSDSLVPLKHVSVATLQVLVAVAPWLLLIGFIVGNSTAQGASPDWGQVALLTLAASAPLLLVIGMCALLSRLRSLARGWFGVVTSWAIAISALFVVALWMGPFI
jgi:hypothetical protein